MDVNEKHRPQTFMICDAFSKGLLDSARGFPASANPYAVGTDWHVAYENGRKSDIGKKVSVWYAVDGRRLMPPHRMAI